MSDASLLFQIDPGGAELVFGDEGEVEAPRFDVTVTATFPELTASALFIPDRHVTVTAAFPAMTALVTAGYESEAERPTVGELGTTWQIARSVEIGVEGRYSEANDLPSGIDSAWRDAVNVGQAIDVRYADAARVVRPSIGSRFACAQRLPASRFVAAHQDALRDRRVAWGSRFTSALRMGALSRTSGYQDADRRPRAATASAFQDAVPLHQRFSSLFGSGAPLRVAYQSRAQVAIRPPAGIWTRPTTPVDPGLESDASLLFCRYADGSAALLFGASCDVPTDNTIVVPVRRVYIVKNTQSLVRVSDGKVIDGTDLRLSIDVDTWVWGWSVSIPGLYLSDLLLSATEQVELEAQINGQAWRLVVERVTRDRRFGSSRLAVSGRGRAAWLADPYATSRTYGNTEAQLAQQLMAEALTENGVSLGWTLDWKITDWLVPASVWNFSGAPIDACSAIAEAVGAYIQAHPSNMTLSVLPRYPSAPWNWAELTPDIELPEDVCVTESVEWADKPDYNTVFVSGQENGVLAHVTRTGTDGGTPAPMVTDALITHADAGRQRGLSILSDTGRQAIITVSLPVLEETGIILPGKILDYSESGNTRRGIVRAVDVSGQFPKVRQSIRLETHVL